MKSSYQVTLTESAIVVLFKGVFQSSIPVRQWSTLDGRTWSGMLRQSHQLDWLLRKLTDALSDPTTESTMRRLHRVLADHSMPPRVPARARPTGSVALAPSEVPSITPSGVQPRAPSALRRHRQIRPASLPQITLGVSAMVSP
jgi:hypothetical protein